MTIPKQLLEAKICNKNTCELQDRIDKAIEYIESKIEHRSYKVDDITRKYDYLEMFDETILELLDILKGSDTNAKD